MKRSDDKTENYFEEYNSVSLTKFFDEDKIRLYEYHLHNKERIRQRHKDYCNNNKKKELEVIVKRTERNERLV